MILHRNFAVVALVLVLAPVSLSGTAAAQPVPEASDRSRATALALSLGGTMASVGLMVGGTQLDATQGVGEAMELLGGMSLLVTPSLGEWYVDEHFTFGLKIRLAGFGLATVGGALLASDLQKFSCWFGTSCKYETLSEVLLVGGAAVFLAGAAYDIATAPRATARHDARSRPRITAAPTLVGTSARPVPGVALGGAF